MASGPCSDRALVVVRIAERMKREHDRAVLHALDAELATARRTMRACGQNAPPAPAAVRGRLVLPAQVLETRGSSSFDVRLLHRMIETRQAALRACYERELRDDPALQGTVDVEVRVLGSGSLEVRELHSSIADPDVGACVERVLSGFRFNPGPRTPASYALRFAFERQP
ncbi:Hypothetical protein I5071_67780 [Sandaracinus amylolyticus]|nr:Hypothetical protein I5071_67780 [Sandaracinus amylolyticus]